MNLYRYCGLKLVYLQFKLEKRNIPVRKGNEEMRRPAIKDEKIGMIKSESGFSLMELIGVCIIFMIVVAVVIVMVTGVFGSSREASLETDVSSVDTALQQYLLKSGDFPTANGGRPAQGEYFLIDFNASFTDELGRNKSFYPDCIKKLPRHYNEGVWRIDSTGTVSADIDPEQY